MLNVRQVSLADGNQRGRSVVVARALPMVLSVPQIANARADKH